MLADLDRAGFVEKHADPADRRRTIVGVNPANRELIREWLDGAASLISRVLDKLDPAEQQAFLKAMNLLEIELHGHRGVKKGVYPGRTVMQPRSGRRDSFTADRAGNHDRADTGERDAVDAVLVHEYRPRLSGRRGSAHPVRVATAGVPP